MPKLMNWQDLSDAQRAALRAKFPVEAPESLLPQDIWYSLRAFWLKTNGQPATNPGGWKLQSERRPAPAVARLPVTPGHLAVLRQALFRAAAARAVPMTNLADHLPPPASPAPEPEPAPEPVPGYLLKEAPHG